MKIVWESEININMGAPVYEYVEEYQKDYMVALLVLLIYLAKTNEEFNYKKKVM